MYRAPLARGPSSLSFRRGCTPQLYQYRNHSSAGFEVLRDSDLFTLTYTCQALTMSKLVECRRYSEMLQCSCGVIVVLCGTNKVEGYCFYRNICFGLLN